MNSPSSEVNSEEAVAEIPQMPLYLTVRKRAKSFERYAHLTLLLTVVLLLLGIALFAFAGQIANFEQKTILESLNHDLLAKLSQSSIESELNQQRQIVKFATELDKEIDQLIEKYGLADLNALVAPPPPEGDESDSLSGDEMTQQVPTATGESSGIIPGIQGQTSLDDLLRQVSIRNALLNAILTSSQSSDSESMADLEAKIVPALLEVPKESLYANVISSLSTRIGALVTLLFIAQILVPVNRYFVRGSLYYNSLGDILEMYPEISIADLGQHFPSLTSSDLTFEGLPKNPLVQILQSLASQSKIQENKK